MQSESSLLASITEGLWVMSETDAKVMVEEWGAAPLDVVSVPWVLEKMSLPAESEVEVLDWSAFLDKYAVKKDYFDEFQLAQAEKFAQLKAQIGLTLTDVFCFKIGHISYDVVIVGHLPNCDYLAIRTKLVET